MASVLELSQALKLGGMEAEGEQVVRLTWIHILWLGRLVERLELVDQMRQSLYICRLSRIHA